jgi:hypothetical protein
MRPEHAEPETDPKPVQEPCYSRPKALGGDTESLELPRLIRARLSVPFAIVSVDALRAPMEVRERMEAFAERRDCCQAPRSVPELLGVERLVLGAALRQQA